MLIGALGCNIAWGIIDGILYLMGCLSEQGRGIRVLRALRKAAAPEEAHRVMADALPPMVAVILGPAEYELMRQKLVQLPAPPVRPRLGKEGWGRWRVPVGVPHHVPSGHPVHFHGRPRRAMRVSNAIAIVLLFLTGYAFGRTAEYQPWLTGLVMVALGSVLVGITMALGG
jgi:hypothetical protein